MHANFPTAKRYFQWDLIQLSDIYIFIENNWYTAMAVNWYYLSVYYFQITFIFRHEKNWSLQVNKMEDEGEPPPPSYSQVTDTRCTFIDFTPKCLQQAGGMIFMDMPVYEGFEWVFSSLTLSEMRLYNWQIGFVVRCIVVVFVTVFM